MEHPRLIHNLRVFENHDGEHWAQAVYETQACGTIKGGGTTRQPLRIELSPLYKAAPELADMLAFLDKETSGFCQPCAEEFVTKARALLARIGGADREPGDFAISDRSGENLLLRDGNWMEKNRASTLRLMTFRTLEDAKVFCVEKKIEGIHCEVYPLTFRAPFTPKGGA